MQKAFLDSTKIIFEKEIVLLCCFFLCFLTVILLLFRYSCCLFLFLFCFCCLFTAGDEKEGTRLKLKSFFTDSPPALLADNSVGKKTSSLGHYVFDRVSYRWPLKSSAVCLGFDQCLTNLYLSGLRSLYTYSNCEVMYSRFLF